MVVALVNARRGARDAVRIAERGVREVEARERRRQRATAMLVWGEFGFFEGSDQIVVINSGSSPVVQVQIKEVKGYRLPVEPPLGRWPVWPVVLPDTPALVKTLALTENGKPVAGLDMAKLRSYYTVVIEFSDMEGYRWRREGNGLPELVE